MTAQKIKVLCENCKQVLVETQAVIIHLSDGKRDILSPQDMIAIKALDKGLYFYMKDGRVIYETLALRDILALYPGIFFRAAREWLVANDAVIGYDNDGPGKHTLRLPLDLRVTVSRREWRQVATVLGVRNKHLGRPPGDMTQMRAMAKHDRSGKLLKTTV